MIERMSGSAPLPEVLPLFLRKYPKDRVTQDLLVPGLEFQVFLDNRPVRIPTDRNGDPVFGGELLTVEQLSKRVSLVGTSGWDYQAKVTRFIILDFDAIDHAAGHSDEIIDRIVAAARHLGWVWVRRSKGGRGIHVIVALSVPMPAGTGTEHQANARAIVDRMQSDSGFDFRRFVDCVGVIGYIWAKEIRPNGFEVLVEPTSLAPEITRTATVANDEPQPTELNDQHQHDIDVMAEAGFVATWDGKRLLCHSKGFEVLYRDPRRPGRFATKSPGTDPTEPNAFAYPLDDGGWSLNRFSVSPEAEADGWYANAQGFASFRVLPPIDLSPLRLADNDEEPKQSPPHLLLAIAREFDLCHSTERVPIVVVEKHGKRRSFILPDREFEAMLAKELYDRTGVIARTEWLKSAMRILEACCLEAQCRSVFTRIGHVDGAFYLDLGDDTLQVVKVTQDGWDITTDCPILFHRSPNVSPMPAPVRGGKLNELRPLLNIKDEEWPVVVAYLLSAWNPFGPYALLVLLGQSGAAKSTLARLLQGIVDSTFDHKRNREELFAPPKNVEDLMVFALHTWLLTFDNLGSISDSLSEAFCRLLTGGATIARRLYSNSGMAKMTALAPCIITAITDPVKADDLRSRSLFLSLELMDPHKIIGEATLAKQYADIRPRVMGALLDCVVCALRHFEHTKPLPGNRLADLTRWILAAEPATGLQPGELADALTANRTEAAEEALNNPLAKAVRKLAVEGVKLETEDLRTLLITDYGVEIDSPESLGWRLRKMASELAAIGVTVKKSKRKWEIGRKAA